jgi:hypothetical protein
MKIILLILHLANIYPLIKILSYWASLAWVKPTPSSQPLSRKRILSLDIALDAILSELAFCELAINTVGGVVTEAQQLMVVVPDEEQLEAEVFMENKDIGFVFEEMPAEIKIHTFPFTKYGVIDAEVSNVSNDAIIDEQLGLIYRMQLRMAKNTIGVNGKCLLY